MSRPISKKTMLAGLAAAGVLTVGIAAPAVAFADNSSGSTATSSQSTSDKAEHGTFRQHRVEQRNKLAETLAAELGVPTDKVEASLAKLQEQHRSEAKANRKGHDERKDNEKRDGDRKTDRKADRQAQLKDRLDQAVSDGKLTQEEADSVLKAFETGVLPGFGGPGRFGAGHGPKDSADTK